MPEETALFTQSGHNTESREWTVGYQGLFKVTITLNDQEREIDVDDRGSLVHLRLEMQDTGSFGMSVLVTSLSLNIAFANRSILINGRSSDEVPVLAFKDRADMTPEEYQSRLLTPTTHLEHELTIQTGIFSSTETPKDAPSARPGVKEVDVDLDYVMVLPDEAQETVTQQATMIFLVADD